MTELFNSELAVVGACMADPKCYWQVADLLVPEDFADGRLQAVFRHIGMSASIGTVFDAVTIADELPQLSDFILNDCFQEGWRTASVRAYAERVVETAMARRVRLAGQQIARLTGSDVLGQAQRILALCAPRHAGAIKHISHFATQSYADITRKFSQSGDVTGISSGIPEVDKLTCGWQPSDLIILAARPSVGKTALAMMFTIALAKAKKDGPALVFSLEMSGKQLTDRAISNAGRINGTHLRNPKQMLEEDWPRLTNALSIVRELPIFIDDTCGSTVDVICARARQQHAVNPLGLIVIDYLQLIRPPKAENTTDAVAIISRTLKQLAKELDIPVIVLSQLNREGEGKRPTMANLRSSGAIEQDADVIMFLHRPHADHRDFIELIFEKQRNGPTADIAMEADMAVMSFRVASHIPEGITSSAKTAPDQFWDELEKGDR